MPTGLGESISRFRIVSRLGAGGMGVVYRAHDESLGRDLALKVLPAETVTDENARARLLREARTASSLNHPHIAHIYEVGEDSGSLFIAMELVEGAVLRERIPGGGMPPEQILPLAIQIADALGYAHSRGVIHRDLKSENVMVTPEGRVKVLDFGLAKRMHDFPSAEPTVDLHLTATGMIMGTPMYLAPEVIMGGASDARSDVWALGVVLYHMATGRLPFIGGSVRELAESIVKGVPAPVTQRVATGLRGVIERCLAKDPNDRYASGAEVHAALVAMQRQALLRADGRVIPRWLRPVVMAFALAGLAAITLLAWRGLGPPPGGARIRSLAVLPLGNLSGDPTQEYLADGMTEELITDLASIPKLKVISRTSVMQFKGSKKSLRQIASELKVEGVIEGSVLRVGDRVRITAQLIEAASDRHLWARSYEKDFRDVLTLQSEVASDIARQIQLQVAAAPGPRGAQRPLNPEAYDLYLRGRFEWSKATDAGARRAIELLEKARALDPGDARYASGLADTYLLMNQVLNTAGPDEGMARVKEYAQLALAADERSAEAHTSMSAALLFGDWNWAESKRHIERAIELNPGYPAAHLINSVRLSTEGRIEEALAQDRLAMEQDPLSIVIAWHHCGVLMLARRNDDALAQAQRTLQMDPNSALPISALVRIYEAQGKFEPIFALMEEHLSEREGGKVAAARFRQAYATGGARAYWRLSLEFLTSPREAENTPPARVGMVYAALGDLDHAFEYLERAYRRHESDLMFLNVDPTFDPLRADPRFAALVKRVGIPAPPS